MVTRGGSIQRTRRIAESFNLWVVVDAEEVSFFDILAHMNARLIRMLPLFRRKLQIFIHFYFNY